MLTPPAKTAFFLPLSLFFFLPLLPLTAASGADWQPHPEDTFVITVIDDATSRGVPLVELITRNHVRFYTDSNGVAAISDPGLMNQKVFFCVSSHGYDYMGRGFLGKGETFDVTPGGSATISIHRRNLAERLYRITGEGIYRDSVMAGKPVPIKNPLNNGKVTGQDTVITAVYNGKISWCWGDTLGLSNMNLSAAGAVSEIPGKGGLDPSVGVDLSYFVNPDTGFSKAMCPYESPGLKWIEGLFTIRDEQGRERLMGRCPSMRGLGSANEWCLLMFNDETQVFDPVVRWNYAVPHRSAHPFHAMVDGHDYVYIFPILRVKADMEHLKDLKQYEYFTPLVQGSRYSKDDPKLDRDAEGRLVYGWKADTDPVDEYLQRELVQAGKIKPEECWYTPREIDSGEVVDFRIGSVCWNEFAKRWILIGERIGGDIWYAEGDTPTGPWVYAKRIVTHDHYTFYNPAQHAFFDQEGGRKIYFEGTYTESFSDARFPTPHYDYNQIMYRLTLDDPRLILPVAVYRVQLTPPRPEPSHPELVEGVEGSAVSHAKARSRYLLRDAITADNLWSQVREVAFFALPPDRNAPDSVAVYADGKSGRLRTRAPRLHLGEAQPLFRALPAGAEVAAASFAGQWTCKAKTDTGFENDFSLQLEQKGKLITLISRRGSGGSGGESVSSSATLTNGNEVTLTIRRGGGFRINVHLRLEQGKIKGTWEQTDGPMNGTLEGTRQEEATPENFVRLQTQSPATAILYEVRTGDKAGAAAAGRASAENIVYTTDLEKMNPALQRSAKPLCRVWKSPITIPQLDWKPQPVPIAFEAKK